MIDDLKQLKNKVLREISESQNLELLDQVWRKYLGRSGTLRKLTAKLKDLSREEKVKIGQALNDVKKELEEKIETRKSELERSKTRHQETIDITLPGEKPAYGHLHPYTQMKYEVMDVFRSMGFEVLEGPELENDYYNFEALNIPEGHPARDMWDTFYIESKAKEQKFPLRTHTSNTQVRVMEKQRPPIRVGVIGRCFRQEATDASHEHTFYQIEGFVVDENITLANLIYTLKSFLGALFGQEVRVRLRPSYFPFVEPGFEADFGCLNCHGRGCPVCGYTGWVEMVGCGMIHPKVFEAAGYPKNKYTGFAFGFGFDRLVMMKYKISDIRWFHSGDLRFIKQF